MFLPYASSRGRALIDRVLIRRSISDPTELAYYLCYGPAGTVDEELIRIAATRWAVEECFQTAKNEVSLDDYQVRRYDAW